MKNLSLFLVTFFIVTGANAQYDIETVKSDTTAKTPLINWFELKDKIYVGGEMGLSFSQNSSYIHLAPVLGYDITPKWSAGISGFYQLFRVQNFNGSKINFNTFGGGVFTRLRPWRPLVLHAELNLYNTIDFHFQTFDRVNVPATMLGIGFANSIMDRSYYQIMLLYDVINNPNMPLPPLIIEPLHLRIGIILYLEELF